MVLRWEGGGVGEGGLFDWMDYGMELWRGGGSHVKTIWWIPSLGRGGGGSRGFTKRNKSDIAIREWLYRTYKTSIAIIE